MKTSAHLLLSFALVGCSSPTSTEPEKKDGPKKSDTVSPKDKKPAANPLVGRWVIKKVGTQDWSPTVSKDAVIEFRGDGPTPNEGTMIVTDRNATGKGDYSWGKDGFFFEVKFRHKDGSAAGGYSGSFDTKKMTDREIVGDLFTLERVK